MARNEQIVRTKSHTRSKFSKIGLRDCSCAPILQFFSAASVGATVERQIQNRIFCQFCNSLRRDSVAIYGSIWTTFPSSVRTLDILYNELKLSEFRR